MKAVIIDDESHVHDVIQRLAFHLASNVQIIGTASSVKEGYELVIEKKPDLIFLDIKMEDGTGFDLLNKLERPYPYTIFVTAHDTFALEAFKFSAIDYLIKPIESESLERAIEKASERYKIGLMKEQIESFNNKLNSDNKGNRIVLRDAENIHFVETKDILWCSAEGSYTTFHMTNNRTLVVSKHLKEYETLLVPYNFIRANRSYIVNCHQIKRYDKIESSLILNGDHRLPISIKKEQLNEILRKL